MYKVKVILVLFIVSIFANFNNLKAQGENWNWFFGSNAGINFPGGGSPVALAGGQVNTSEGCSTISDASGNLLFYTDGVSVWNKLHALMPNGTGLMGAANSAQSSLIVKRPGSATQYYIFTAAAGGGANGVRYSIVDITLNAGLGDVTATKNVLLFSPACERLIGVKHCNKTDVWIIAHEYNSTANYRAYLITSAGVSITPVVSNVGLTISPNVGNSNAKSLLKASPRGNKIACTNISSSLEIYDFNKITGVISNGASVAASVHGTGTWYGIEFSSDGTKLYADIRAASKLTIIRFDLCAGNNTAIIGSGLTVIAPTTPDLPGTMYSGPNGNIYIARNSMGPMTSSVNIGQFLAPNTNTPVYSHNAIPVNPGAKSIYGLQNITNDFILPPPLPPFTVASFTCRATAFSYTPCTAITNSITGYAWNFGDPSSGPLNTSTLANPTHTYAVVGNYSVTLILTTPCSSDTIKQIVSVINQNPPLSFAVSNSITCALPNAILTGTSFTSGVTYSWSPQNVTTNTALATAPGNYTLTVTNSTNTCFTQSIVTVNHNTLAPVVNAIATNTLNCLFNSAILTATSATSPLNYQWSSGPNSFSNTVNAPGNYSVTATNPVNGCTNTAIVTVVQNTTQPNISASVSNTLTCTQPTISLVGSSTTSAVTYSWSPTVFGPANQPTALANAVGNYSLTITNTVNGCKSTTVISVLQNTLQPNISANVSNTLTCLLLTANLTGTSSTSGVTYSWSPNAIGPLTQPTATANLSANYTLAVTDPSNGCKSTTVITVSQNTLSPNINISISNSLTCLTPSAVLNATSTTTGITYTWSSNVTSPVNQQTASASSPGSYTVVVTNPVNGCTNIATATVMQNAGIPTVAITQPATLTCVNLMATLNATSSGNNCFWNGNSLTNATNPATVNTPGSYTVTVTNPVNSCSSQSVVTVQQSTLLPNISATISNSLNCLQLTATLNGTSTTTGVNYNWSPNVFGPASQPAAVANAGGNFTLTVTNPLNGCSSQSILAVQQSTTLPNISATISNIITCQLPTATLNGTSTTAGVTYSWFPNVIGPTSLPTATANSSGNYTLTITNPFNSCSTQTTVTVFQSTTLPNISANVSNTLTCIQLTANLNGTSTTAGVTYSWSPNVIGPASLSTASANSSGSYTLTVTDPSNGCSSQTIVAVQQYTTLPNISASVSSTLTCLVLSANLTGTSTTGGVTYSWSPNVASTLSLPTATTNLPGIYTLTVTDPLNGCMSSTILTVIQNTVPLAFNLASSNNLNCSLTTSTLTASGNGAFVWNGGNLSNSVNPAIVSGPGSYTVTATNPANGCLSNSVITVTQNTIAPNATASVSGHLNCNTNSVTLTGSSITTGVTYSWSANVSGPIVFPTAMATAGGTYTFFVTDILNGCHASTTITVVSIPTLTSSITQQSQINCFGQNTGALQINLVGGGNPPFTITNLNTSNVISNVNTFPVSLNNLGAAQYSVQVTDADGCTQILSSTINQPPPLICAITGTNNLCEGINTNLSSIANGGTTPYTYFWTNTNSANPNISITASVSTTYSLVVTDSKGCTSATQFALTVNPKPNAGLVNGKLVGCAPVCASFELNQDQSLGNTYSWSFTSPQPTPTVYTTGVFNPEICFTKEGVYSASIFIKTVHGCSANVTYSNLITVYPKPTANFYFSPEHPDITDQPEVVFTNNSQDAKTYSWYLINTLFSQQTSTNYIFTDPGKYLVTLIAKNDHCSDTTSQYVVVDDDFFFYIPNSFTPNDDGTNDYFYPVITGNYSTKDYSFEIFDRWGALLYRSDNIHETQWNGYYKNEICKDDTYIWRVNVRSNKGKTIQKTGHVVLMK